MYPHLTNYNNELPIRRSVHQDLRAPCFIDVLLTPAFPIIVMSYHHHRAKCPSWLLIFPIITGCILHISVYHQVYHAFNSAFSGNIEVYREYLQEVLHYQPLKSLIVQYLKMVSEQVWTLSNIPTLSFEGFILTSLVSGNASLSRIIRGCHACFTVIAAVVLLSAWMATRHVREDQEVKRQAGWLNMNKESGLLWTPLPHLLDYVIAFGDPAASLAINCDYRLLCILQLVAEIILDWVKR